MKKTIMALFFIFVIIGAIYGNTLANIIEVRGQIMIIDKGSQDGVQAGMKGIIKAVYKEPGGEYDINIGIFLVKKALERTAELAVENMGPGFLLEDARYVIFEKDLNPLQKNENEVKPSENLTVIQLLEMGDKLSSEGKYAEALETYKRAQKHDPENVVVQEKISDTQKHIAEAQRLEKYQEYIRKADTAYAKKDIKFSILYLAEAFKQAPNKKEDIRKRLLAIQHEYSDEVDLILEEKELGELSSLAQESPPVKSETKTEAHPSKQDEMVNKKEEAKEDFLQALKKKAQKLEQNEQGFWEAHFDNELILVNIPAGNFTLGSPDKDGDADEHPAHPVVLSEFWISKYETTFEQFDRYCQETKTEIPQDEGWGRGKNPVIHVSWADATKYCEWLAKKTGLPIRLPTEAEWEKTANNLFPWGDDKPNANYCNFNNRIGNPVPVGSYPEGISKFGVHDLAGNVWEWTQDWYQPDYYEQSPEKNPTGPKQGTERVVRGGCFEDRAELIRSANRSSENPSSRLNCLGFRVTLSTE